MKLYKFFIFVFFLSSCSSNCVNRLYKKKPAFYSYIVGNINNDRIDKEYNSDVYASPASCQKVITALLSFKILGPGYRYKTKLLVKEKNGHIYNAVIEFTGDPTLTSENLRVLLEPLRGKNIAGKIILDASIFKTPAHSTYLMISDIGKESARPVSATIIDRNLINIDIIPTKLGEIAQIKSDAECNIDNNIVTSKEKSICSIRLVGDDFVGRGNLNIDDVSFKISISPKKIDTYILDKIRKITKELNIKGDIYIEHNKSNLPLRLKEFSSTLSEPISNIIPAAMKISDNLVFDSLYLNIVHQVKPEGIDDWSDGDFVIRNLLKTHYNIDLGKSLVIDGSGISRYNRIQPKILYKILQKAYLQKEFLDSLPKNAENGSTLVNRKLQDGIRAKTGSAAGVACLCGYNIDTSKIFVIIANGFAPPTKEMHEIIDDFVKQNL